MLAKFTKHYIEIHYLLCMLQIIVIIFLMNSFSLSNKIQNSQRDERGLVGLQNIGNTCFLNSVIQCLSNTKPILEYILTQEYCNEIRNQNRCLLIKRFAELITNIWEDHKSAVTNTYSLKNAIVLYAPRFSGFNQQDAQEFLRYLLEGIHEEINRSRNVSGKPGELSTTENQLTAEETWRIYLKRDNSKIVDTFGGLLRSVLKCSYCGFSSTIYEPFWDLSLPIPSGNSHSYFHKVNLNKCLDLFTKEETLEGCERPFCSKCKAKQTCVKRILIQRFPQILVIHLKRFSTGGTARKVDTFVDFPNEGLNMAAYCAEAQTKNITYNLYGVVNHFGSCQFGHYTAYCKHPYSGIWHSFNDRIVSPLDLETNVKSDAYILFYSLM